MSSFFTMNADVLDFRNGALVGKEGMRVRFELYVKKGDMVVATGGVRPSLIDGSTAIVGWIRSDGRMYDTPSVSSKPFDLTDPGNLGVRLLAATPDLNITPSYKVTFEQVINGVNIVYRTIVITGVPTTDTSVTLASYSPVPRGGDFA